MKYIAVLLGMLLSVIANAASENNYSRTNALASLLVKYDQPIVAFQSGTLSRVSFIMQNEDVFLDSYTGVITVQLYSDNSGVPGTALGNAISVNDADMVFNDSDAGWNGTPSHGPFVDFSGLGVSVVNGHTYHVVITGDDNYVNNGEAIDIGGDLASLDDTSNQPSPLMLLWDGTSWSSSSGTANAMKLSTEVEIN